MKKLDPYILTKDAQNVVEQLNRKLPLININTNDTDTRLIALEAVTADDILNTAMVAQVNSDFDIVYSDVGEIITNG